MLVLGFSGIRRGAYYREKYGLRFVGHDASVALVRDGEVLFAAEEERFSRHKHTSDFPVNAFRAALRDARLSIPDLDAIAYPWKVTPAKYLHMLLNHAPRVPLRYAASLAWVGLRVTRDLMSPRRIGRQFAAALGEKLPVCEGVSHHLGHSACAYFTSPFNEAAVLTVDGQGEDESGSLGEWQGTTYRHIRSIYSPDSIGILYGMVTDFLGMRAAWDEYKVMGMASYGDPDRFIKGLSSLVHIDAEGSYRSWRTAMVFQPGYSNRFLQRVLAVSPREPGEPLTQDHFDLAAALQKKTEETVFHLLETLRRSTTSRNLCLAGGVFQNSVLNGKILRSGLYEQVHVPPVPGDHGGALGAALYVNFKRGRGPRKQVPFSAFTGPDAACDAIDAAVQEYRDRVTVFTAEPCSAAASRLAEGQVIAWVQGRMEYGPRALGHRSILASPLQPEMRDTVNARVKHREEFRPFAGAVPLDRAAEFFELTVPTPYMQFVVPVRAEMQARIPAVVHFGTCRAQTVSRDEDPKFYELLMKFGELTGVPVLLNTSFNDADEPIVCTPRDAIRSFLAMELDALIMSDRIVTKRRASDTG
jgi:carbamoyltransferase